MQKKQFELNDPPSDGISNVKFSYSNPSLLLVSIRLYDVTKNKMKLKYFYDTSVLDYKSIDLWDQRSSIPCVGKFSQPEKVYTLDVVNNILVVGMAARQIYIYDIRNLSEAMQKRESSLKFMTHVIKCMPNGEGYASSSIEGCVALEFLDTSEESQKRKYAFKCHREIIDGISHVYPVNALSFHPIKFIKYPTTISSLSFNIEGSILAVASSYTFEEGEKE
ncbi:hypothetical protein H8356DRAFT_1282094 [Neocallimastix lanati (nom. inval.)]|nr:hypothetical protein H8356DRAFT_1282094 [Neocallimastix sp. JGI-2020a]